MGVDPAQCVYVGDAERDMQAAQAAGMFAVVAGYGYLGDDDRADEWFSHGWLDTPLDLLAGSTSRCAANGARMNAANVNGIT